MLNKMACDIVIQTKQYNTETQQTETVSTVVGQVNETEFVSMDKVVDLIAALPLETRQQLAAKLRTAGAQSLTAAMIKEHQFVGNTTIQDILKTYPALAQLYDINPSLYSNYTIIKGSKFQIAGVNYNGRVLDAKGNEMFIITSEKDARNFIQYLYIVDIAEKLFADESTIPETITPAMRKVLQILAKRKNLSIFEVIKDYLNNKSSYTPFVYDGTPITPRAVLDKVVGILANDEVLAHNRYTDFEIAIHALAVQTNSNRYDWKLPKVALYKLLTIFDPELKERISLENFENMTAVELQTLFTGKNGLFMGHPKLERAKIKEVTTATKEVQTSGQTITKTGKLTKEYLKASWNAIRDAVAEQGVTLPEKYSTYEKLDPESMAKLFNDAKVQYTDEGGNVHTVKAKVVTSDKGKKRVQYSYEYEATLEPKVKKGASFVTLTFPLALMGDIHNFGYETTQSIYSPVTEGPVQNGEYNGMYIYKATRSNGRTVYAISRSIISPYSYMEEFATLEDAIYNVDKHVASDKIGENGLISIKQTDGATPREAAIEMQLVHEGQILSVLDMTLPQTDIKKLPRSIQQLFTLTVKQFQDRLASIPNIKMLNTPEKAAAFIIKTVDQLAGSREAWEALKLDTSGDVVVDLFTAEEAADTVKGIITEIGNASKRHYFIEKYVRSKESNRQIALLKLLKNGETDVNIEGTKVGDRTISEFIGQTMDGAITFLNEKYGMQVISMTSSELEEFSIKNNLGLENKVNSIHAFIYNGQIYINTSNSKVSDLYHEVAHLFFGALKVKYPKGYQALLKSYSEGKHKKRFLRKFAWMKRTYLNMANQDIMEEAVVDMIAEDIMRDKRLATEFDSGVFREIMQNIFNTVDDFKSDLMESGLGFDQFMSALVSGNASEMQKFRIKTNFIQQMIQDKKIIENC